MQKTQDIRIEDFNYPLPDERIAKFPLTPRDSSKLLIYQNGNISESRFSTLADHLPAGSTLVFNNTKVIQARLHFRKETGALIEIFCLEPTGPADYLLSFQSTNCCRWKCMIGNLKKWKDGSLTRNLSIEGEQVCMKATRQSSDNQFHEILFEWDNPHINFATLLDVIGELPIPPYLNRETEESDKETYQTVYSKIEGSVAAPTAGLHFTAGVFDSLNARNINCRELTLHVGAGTFKPVKSDTIAEHEMHTEFISIEKTLLADLIANAEQIIAVGTTSVRTLESLYFIGQTLALDPTAAPEQLKVTQWQPYQDKSEIPAREALQHIADYLDRNNLQRLVSTTQILIAPGYKFRLVKGIVTNFHQPQSTLLLLVSAFVDGKWKQIYDYALSHDFRFLSYGDSSLLLP